MIISTHQQSWNGNVNRGHLDNIFGTNQVVSVCWSSLSEDDVVIKVFKRDGETTIANTRAQHKSDYLRGGGGKGESPFTDERDSIACGNIRCSIRKHNTADSTIADEGNGEYAK